MDFRRGNRLGDDRAGGRSLKHVCLGVSPDAAKGIVASYNRATEQVQSAGGKSEMLQGGLLLGVSLLVVVYASGSIIGWIGMVLGPFSCFVAGS